MAEVVLTNAHLTLNSVDLSDHVRSITLNYNSEPQDITAMSDTTRQRTGGLLDWSVSIEFNQDYAANEVDVTLFSLVGTTFAMAIRPDAGSVATTNPEYTGTCLLESYQPVGGQVGEVHVAPVQLTAASALARATS